MMALSPAEPVVANEHPDEPRQPRKEQQSGGGPRTVADSIDEHPEFGDRPHAR